VPSSIRGTPWYARRHAGPDMITTSPERRRIGIGSASLVRPPMRKTAALPSLRLFVNMRRRNDGENAYDIDTKGEVAQTSDLSTWPIRVS